MGELQQVTAAAHKRASATLAPMTGRVESSEEFFLRDEVVAEYASFDFLLAPEQAILERLDGLESMRVLDLGVGGGRTTSQLLGRVGEYVGVDLSPQMVQACRERFAAWIGPRVRFAVGDATDLGDFPGGGFDLVLFAFQGIDSVVEHDRRLRVLGEVRRVCADGATFAFSSDNLLYARRRMGYARALRTALSRGGAEGRLARARRSLAATRRLRRANAPVRALGAAHARYVIERPVLELGRAQPAEQIRIDGYCVEPAEARRQLHAAGFHHVELYGVDGSRLTHAPPRELVALPWLYYACRAAARPAERST